MRSLRSLWRAIDRETGGYIWTSSPFRFGNGKGNISSALGSRRVRAIEERLNLVLKR